MKHCEEERVGVETWRQWIGGPNWGALTRQNVGIWKVHQRVRIEWRWWPSNCLCLPNTNLFALGFPSPFRNPNLSSSPPSPTLFNFHCAPVSTSGRNATHNLSKTRTLLVLGWETFRYRERNWVYDFQFLIILKYNAFNKKNNYWFAPYLCLSSLLSILKNLTKN